jgi:hypothetical protein
MELREMMDEEEDEKDEGKIKELVRRNLDQDIASALADIVHQPAQQTVFHDLSLGSHRRPTAMKRDYDDLAPNSAAAQAADLSLRQLYGKVRFIDQVKATAVRSYSLIVHPEKTKCLAISGDKRGMLGM